MSYDLKVLEQGCEELGIALNDTQKQQFIAFYEYLAEKNKVMNLTGITEFQEVLVKHFLDSLACVKAVDMTKVSKIMDIGTGAGFPGVPLKIAFPHLEACLLDSLKKRVNFLEETFALLKLENITAIHGRAEEFAKNKAYREQYDLCVSRAVSNLATLSEYCLPFPINPARCRKNCSRQKKQLRSSAARFRMWFILIFRILKSSVLSL